MVITDLEIAQASIELVGGFVSIMLAVIIIINGHKEPSMKLIQKMLFTAAFDFTAEALAYIFRGNVGPFSLFMTRFCNAMVFYLNFLLAILTMRYIYSLLEAKGVTPSKKYRNIIVGCFLAATAMLFVNLFTGWMYYFDADNYYHRSFGWYIYTALSLVCLVVACILVIRNRKSLSRMTIFSLLLFEVFPIVAIVIQSLYYGISITNIGIGASIVLLLITYLIDWNRSEEVEDRTLTQVRRSYETIVLFVIMVISISASITSCVISINRISSGISVSSSQVVAHIVDDHINNVFLRPITVTETMSKDQTFQNNLKRSSTEGPEAVAEDMANYLEAIRTGFGYHMVYAVSEETKTYYTCNGIVKTVDIENDPADVWYRDFMDSGMRYQLKVDTDEANNWDLSVFVNTEIRDDNGTLLGVCGIGLEMQDLQTQLAAFEDEYGLKITLIDRDGLIQIDSDTARIEQDYLPIPPQGNSSDEFLYEELNGTSRLTKFAEDLDWYLVVEDLHPNKVNIMEILVPNIAIFMVGLFMLAVAFTVIMIRERKISAELIEKRRTSLYDELTRLKNRRAFDQDCAKIAEEDTVKEIVAIMVDLNGLKEINDRQGHQAGDELITATAEAMRQTLGEYGSLYRIGGDEYFALLTCTKAQMEDAMALFEYRTANWNGKLIHSISTAKGIAVGAEHPEMSIGELVELADHLMYEDKNAYYIRTGKDRRRHRS